MRAEFAEALCLDPASVVMSERLKAHKAAQRIAATRASTEARVQALLRCLDAAQLAQVETMMARMVARAAGPDLRTAEDLDTNGGHADG